MKRLRIFTVALAAIAIMAGCKNSKPTNDAPGNDSTAVSNVSNDGDSTVYGVCKAGAMHTMEMQGEDGKYYNFQIDMEDSATVMGGLLEGDRMAVTYRVEKGDGYADTIATRVINLSTLEAEWSSIDRNFEIQKGGTIQSHQQGETKPWTSWRIYNGHFLMDKDTFDITRLDADSLFLENQVGLWAYKRIVRKH